MGSVSAGVTPLYRVRPAQQEPIDTEEDLEMLKAARECRMFCEGVLERAKQIAESRHLRLA